MRLELDPTSKVLIDLKSEGLLKAIAHDPTLACTPEALVLEVGPRPPSPGGELFDVPVEVLLRVDRIEPPAHMAHGDRDRMRENLRSPAVLDALRYPTIELRARYRGTLDGGTLSGECLVRGAGRPMTMPVAVTSTPGGLRATGTWEGKLTELGIRPYKALLGGIRLTDWVRLRLEALFRIGTPA